MGKLITRLAGSLILITSLPGSALSRSTKLRDSATMFEALHCKIGVKRHLPIFYYFA